MSGFLLTRPRLVGMIVVLALVASLTLGLYFWMRPRTPDAARYEAYTEAFEIGTAAVDADLYNEAESNLNRAIELIPEEPAAWANRGLLYLRHRELEKAAHDLEKAHQLAPDSPEIETLLGLLAEEHAKLDAAVAHLRKAVQMRPRDLRAQYALAKLVEQAAADDSDAEYQRLLEDILRVQPNNLKALVERARKAALRRDAAALKDSLSRLRQLSTNWSRDTLNRLEAAERAAAGLLPGNAPIELAFLNNLMMAERGYLRSAVALAPSLDKPLGETLQQFLRLTRLRTMPDPPDLGLTFTPESPANIAVEVATEKWDVALPIRLTGEGLPVLFVANARTVRRVDGSGAVLAFPSGPRQAPPTADSILPIDWDNDSRTDFVLAGAGGLKFWKQGKDGAYTDATAKTGLDAAILGGDYVGAWAADIEMDGDLDIVLAPRNGPPLVLRNNQDGTFKVLKPFAGVSDVRAFVWADLDNDGAPDAALLDAQGRLHVFTNERGGQFRAREVPTKLGRLIALATADVSGNSALDLLGLRDDGVLVRLTDEEQGQGWESASGFAQDAKLPADIQPGAVRLLAADLDNNGMVDLVAAGPRGVHIWLGEGPDKFAPLPAEITGAVFAAEDLSGNGRLDLVAVSERGQPLRLVNQGTKDYHWLDVRPQANPSEKQGDNRINSSGIGGEIQVRAGTLVRKQLIAKPRVHFGLGNRQKGDLLRIVWTNGNAQTEFALKANGVVVAEQRLSGSCPFLFTWDGRRFQFVGDFMWSTPLGLFINGQDTGGFMQMQEWVKIRGDQLVPRDGFYDVRVAATLWEADFFDHLALRVVDHPADTEVFVDERFALVPTLPQAFLTRTPRPVARAWDDHGTEVTDIVRAIDGRYLDTFGRGRFQGVTRDHWVEVDLGDEAPREGPLWLLAHGWIHPTDSSINVALTQGQHDPPRPLVLEIPDGKGGWQVGWPALGFPAGKNKTMLIRLDGITGKGVARRFRLRTNMEIYWDALQYAVGLDATGMQQHLDPEVADLRYRGMLEITQENASSPELPHYDRVATVQKWRDLIGYYTRFGDVRELLAKVDDRYAILNAGDEIALRFRVPAGPPPGWKRDFIWVSEGWTKDGNLNTRFSKTVLPLPAHDLKAYARPPGRLQDDPVYRRFPDDWRLYHTRYVTPARFEKGLRP